MSSLPADDWLTLEEYTKLRAWAEAIPVILPAGFTVMVRGDGVRLEEGKDKTGE